MKNKTLQGLDWYSLEKREKEENFRDLQNIKKPSDNVDSSRFFKTTERTTRGHSLKLFQQSLKKKKIDTGRIYSPKD